jgi:hypothetical protein
MSSRHRRQPSRALPLDFNVADVDGDEPAPAAASKGTASTHGPAISRSDAAGAAKAGQEGRAKKLPPAAGSGRTSAPEGTEKTSCDGNGTGR